MMCDGSNVYFSFKAAMNTNTILRSSKSSAVKWEHQLFLLTVKPQSEGLQLSLRSVVHIDEWRAKFQLEVCEKNVNFVLLQVHRFL